MFLVGDSLGHKAWKWLGGVATSDGFIHVAPYSANQVLQIDARPIDINYKSIVGGINDSPKYDPDRLGYHKYAKALAEVTRSIESPLASVCVGLFGEWGTGKSFLWKEIKGELKGIAQKRIAEIQMISTREEEENKYKYVPVFDRSVTLAFVCWCWFARNFCWVFCYKSILKEEEKVASLMLLMFPVGIIIWIVAFIMSSLVFFLKYMIVTIYIVIDSIKEDESFRKNYVKYFYSHYWEELYGKRVRMNENDPMILDNVYIILFKCLCRDTNDDDEEKQLESGEKPQLRWSRVRDILNGTVDPRQPDATRQFEQVSCFLSTELLLLIKFQKVINSVKAPIKKCNISSEEYKIDDDMKKYIFVEFNVSIISFTIYI